MEQKAPIGPGDTVSWFFSVQGIKKSAEGVPAGIFDGSVRITKRIARALFKASDAPTHIWRALQEMHDKQYR